MVTHGGDWAGFQAEYGTLPLDFSSNISPLGLPEGVREAVWQALALADRYPDPLCRTLRLGLAACHEVGAEQIVCGNGAADLIYRLIQLLQPQRALLPVPGFSEYKSALRSCGTAITYFPLPEAADFTLPDTFLTCIRPPIDVLFLCEPNNPTGRLTPPHLMQKILDLTAERNITLIVDECFNPLLDEPSRFSLVKRLSDYPQLIILRAFTKSYALPGLRLGYVLCGNAGLAARLQNTGPPWAVSTPAQAAGAAALQSTDYLPRLRDLLSKERLRLQIELTALGCRVVPGCANFLLFLHQDTHLAEKLRGKGILLRDCRNFTGLSAGWYRTAVRTAPENDVLLQALKEIAL